MVAYRLNTSTTTEIRNNAEGANLDFPFSFMMVNKIMDREKKIDLERTDLYQFIFERKGPKCPKDEIILNYRICWQFLNVCCYKIALRN